MIPKNLHQIWFGSDPAPKHWMETWEKLHPDWNYYLWTESHFLLTPLINKELFESFIRAKVYHGAADVVRYELLAMYGGFVAPADSECLQSIDPLIEMANHNPFVAGECFACYENELVRPGLISPHLACEPGNPLMKELIKRLGEIKRPYPKWKTSDPWKVTGNKFLTQVIKEFKPIMTIYPSHYFIPEHYTGLTSNEKPVFARHHWYTTKKESK